MIGKEGRGERGLTLEDAGRVIRIVCQVIGLLLVLIGTLCALNMFFKVMGVLDDPAELAPLTDGLEERLGAEELVVIVAEENVPLGKVVAMFFASVWFFLGVWIPLSLIYVGGRIVAWNFDERRQVKTILKGFLEQTREDAREAD